MELNQDLVNKLQNAMNRNQGLSKDLSQKEQVKKFERFEFPKGMKEWEVYVDKDKKVYLTSNNFDHDAWLALSGDFGSLQEKMDYAQKIQKLLNKEV